MDSLSTGIGSKSKPCTKFFSTAGCLFGENCHFLHCVPGGYNAVAQMMNLAPAPSPAPRTGGPPLPVQNGSAPAAVKTKICNKYKTAEGCNLATNATLLVENGNLELVGAPLRREATSGPSSLRISPKGHALLGIGAILHMG